MDMVLDQAIEQRNTLHKKSQLKTLEHGSNAMVALVYFQSVTVIFSAFLIHEYIAKKNFQL